MDMRKLLSIVDNSRTKSKTVITEGTNMAQQMVMQQYTQSQQSAPKFKSGINEYLKIVNNEMLGTLQEQKEQKKIEVKKIADRALTRMDESKTAKATSPKPRNFVAKNATTSGAGAHKDKKKADKQGDVKHKAKAVELAEKAVSKSQQKLMGMVHATQKGEKAASPEVAKIAKGMSKKAATDFASTKHKGLPEKKKKTVKESYGSIEVGSPVKVYSNVLKKAVFGKVVNLKEGRAYVQYANTKIVMGHPIETLQLNEAAAAPAAKVAAATGGKLASRLIPGVGAAVGAYDAYDRAKKGDYIGASLSGLGAITSFIPGIGTAATLGLTGAQLARDYKKKTGAFAPDEADAAAQAATPAPGAMTPNPKTAAPAGAQLQAMQKELAAAGAKNKDGTPLAVDGKMGPNTQGAMSNPKYAAIVKKYTTAPTQTATPAPGSNLAAAARTVAPAAGAVARQALTK